MCKQIKFEILKIGRKKEINKKGQATYITPLNLIPLLHSCPGGFKGSWLCRTCPAAKVQSISIFPTNIYIFLNLKNHIKNKELKHN